MAEQTDEMSRDDYIEREKRRVQYLLDLQNLKPQEHNWVDRGEVMSCEGAMHPHHRAFKKRSYKAPEASEVL